VAEIKTADLSNKRISSRSTTAGRLQQQIASNSRAKFQQINLSKNRREKPDESDTKMIRINVIRKGFGPIFHGNQMNSKITTRELNLR
jgi:hypothetical protein